MYLEIVSPEAVLFSSEVDSVTVPGIQGEFQMLNNHAPIVSVLGKGIVKINVHTQQNLELEEKSKLIVPHVNDNKVLTVKVKGGIIELQDNKVIILAD